MKCFALEEFAIVGFEPGGKHRIAALHLARTSGRSWSYVGKVGTGFSGKVSVELRKWLGSGASGYGSGQSSANDRRSEAIALGQSGELRDTIGPCLTRGQDLHLSNNGCTGVNSIRCRPLAATGFDRTDYCRVP